MLSLIPIMFFFFLFLYLSYLHVIPNSLCFSFFFSFYQLSLIPFTFFFIILLLFPFFFLSSAIINDLPISWATSLLWPIDEKVSTSWPEYPIAPDVLAV